MQNMKLGCVRLLKVIYSSDNLGAVLYELNRNELSECDRLEVYLK